MGEGKILRRAYALVFVLLLASMTGLLSSFHLAQALTTIYIQMDGTIFPITAPIQRNGNVYTLTGNINSDADGIIIERNNTILDGAGHSLQGTNSPLSNGIYLSANYNVTIKNIDVKGFESGILLDAYSTYNNILGNRVENNDYGVNCWAYADNNSIIGNNITANDRTGIWIVGSSNVSIAENTIMGTGQYGISLESSSNDTIYHNSLIDNANHVSLYDSAVIWDNGYPSGGNYWSGYVGTDLHRGPCQNETGADGIGDTSYIIDVSNVDNYPLVNPWTPPDIAVTNITTSKTVVGQGFPLNINVTLTNQGAKVEDFNVIVQANTIVIQTESILLLGGQSITITVEWDTTGSTKGNYAVTAHVEPLLGETDTVDNSLTYGPIYVGIPGDVNGDGIVEMMDFFTASLTYGVGPGNPRWNPDADINDDEAVEMMDFFIMSQHYDEHFP
jgi:parallel beta-helix repeat protein